MKKEDFVPMRFIKHESSTDVAWQLLDVSETDIGLELTVIPWNIAGMEVFSLGFQHLIMFILREEKFELWSFRKEVYGRLSDTAKSEGPMVWTSDIKKD